MREIDVKTIENAVKTLCIESNLELPKDICEKIDKMHEKETGELACHIFDVMKKNRNIAKEKQIPICQDTGMAIVFIKLGQDVSLKGGSLKNAINTGVSRGYTEGFLRASIVSDPIERINTGDNTPAVIYTDIVDGENVEITVAPKGFGSENMSALKMFNPSATTDEICDFVAETCINAGSNPCPPVFVGVGIGGTADKACVLSKEALVLKDIKKPKIYSEMEQSILKKINNSGIGPQGLSGDTTAFSVVIKPFPTHIAGLPVAVTIGCHVTRHKTITL